jgi:SAM-dependent methyltransferase
MSESLIRRVIADYELLLGENDTQFLGRIFTGGLEPYIRRLQAIGFVNRQRVLDAGCGFGQWSLALGSLNARVDACDVSAIRLVILQELARELGLEDLTVRNARLEHLPYENDAYDIVFCYGVIFCTPWKQSLAELTRVLAPKGRLYVNANDIGWTMHLWKTGHNRAADYDPRAVAKHNLANTLAYERSGLAPTRSQLVVSQADLIDAGKALGLNVVSSGGEGCVHLDTTVAAPTAFFNANYYGLPGCHEVVFEKS